MHRKGGEGGEIFRAGRNPAAYLGVLTQMVNGKQSAGLLALSSGRCVFPVLENQGWRRASDFLTSDMEHLQNEKDSQLRV